MFGRPETGFVVLPDGESIEGTAGRLLPWGTTIAHHPSGRPWIIGRCWDRQIVRGAARDGEVVLLGHTSLTAADLDREIQRASTVSDLDRIAALADGSFHLVARLGQEIRVQGSALGICRVYRTEVEGSVVASDRAQVLRWLTGAAPDTRALAGHLLEPVPYWIGEQALLKNIRPVPPTSYLTIGPDGRRMREPRWWVPPAATLDLTEGAELVREKLAAAVDTRTAPGGLVSSELSGGYDSTSVSFLAARGSAKVVLHTAPSRDSTSEDLDWATMAAADLPGLEHDILPLEELPFVYASLTGFSDQLDEPSIAVPSQARVTAIIRRFAERGSRIHLTGHGGDHLFISVPTYYHDLFATHPLKTLRQLRAFAALSGWSSKALAREVADRRGYREWMTAHTSPVVGAPDIHAADLGWMMPPHIPGWITREGRDMIGMLLREMAEQSEPLGESRGLHADLDSINEGVRMVRAMNQMSVNAGVPMAAPFFDDRVVEAALAVSPEQRVTPWSYKPVLGAAMRGIVPDRILARTSKDDGSIDVAHGLNSHQEELISLWEDSRLAELGLVDARALRELCAQPSAPELDEGSLYSTIACETWLRGLEGKALA